MRAMPLWLHTILFSRSRSFLLDFYRFFSSILPHEFPHVTVTLTSSMYWLLKLYENSIGFIQLVFLVYIFIVHGSPVLTFSVVMRQNFI